jgi:aspartyl-tRNA(Asn)/glutamyl-tRNA(Gln) amidotransferase subunit A
MNPDLSNLTVTLALEQLAQKEYSVLDLVEACFRRIQALDSSINAFIYPMLEQAVQQAMHITSLQVGQSSTINELLLPGIPLAVKDLIDVQFVPSTAGSKFFLNRLPEDDAFVVRQLKSSGAIILGKTNTHEIALGVTGINPHFGTVTNPWNRSCISGGSSSGSAAAVASGMCLAALGTDTGGSIRIPASLCGVVGLKPTYGRVSTRGVLPLSWNLDHVGIITRSVRDAALLLSVLADYDPKDPTSVDAPIPDYLAHLGDDIHNWRIVRAVGDYIEDSTPEVLCSLEQAGDVFRSLGARVEDVDLTWLQSISRANTLMTQSDAAAFHHNRIKEHPELFGQDVLERLRIGASITSTEYSLARRTQVESRRRFELLFEEADIFLLPATPDFAPKIADTKALEAAGRLTRFTSPFNLAGLPAISIPCGFSSSGLPIGLQLVSKRWDEARLLQAANAFERETEWHLKTPDF